MSDAVPLESFFKKSDQFVSRRIAEEVVIVPLRQKRGETDYIYSLNETAASAWGLLDGNHSLQSVVDQIVAEYAVETAGAVQDLLDLVEELTALGALEKV